MQKYRMLKTIKGVHDGKLHPTTFNEGEEHDIGDNLAGQFIELGAVELVLEEGDEKAKGDAPSNKMKKPAIENKGK